jgi:prepilin-type N-terminal cleavage/methylation domain-containing protein
MRTINSKRGITLMELMVVLAIMSILSTVAMPKMFGAGEKAREKIDLMKLYDLRNAINLALIEDMDAMTHYEPSEAINNPTNKNTLINRLNEGLSSDQGAALFVIELHDKYSINIQGRHDKANAKYNVSELIGQDGTFYWALKDANFDGVADIIADRYKKGGDANVKNGGDTYTSIPWKKGSSTYYRTAPKRTIFQSKALNAGKKENDNERFTVSLRWSDPDNPGFSVEVYILPNEGSWNTAYRSKYGTCFSTYGRKGCAKSK